MIALFPGSFDITNHPGHLKAINFARRLGDVLIALGTDEYQRRYKHDPVMSYEERKWGLEESGKVWRVVPRDDDSMVEICERFQPTYLVAGMDWWRPDHLDYCGLTVDFVNEHEISLVYLPRSHEMSTSEIIKRIRGLAVA